jgi:hypothetical protein
MLVVPNIVFWIIAPKVQQVRGLFVIEYSFIACLYPFIKRRLFFVIWILFAIYDLALAVCSLFFMDVFELVHALNKIPSVSVGDLGKWAGILLLFILVIVALLRLLVKYDSTFPFLRFRFLWPMMLAGLVMLVVNNYTHALHISLPHSKKDIVSAPVQSAVHATIQVIIKSQAKKEIEHLGSAAKTVFANEPDSIAANKEVLVLVESWGLLNNKALQQAILQPLYDLVKKHPYTIHEGTNQYKYLTQEGEFRELTGYIFHYYQVHDSWVRQNSLLIEKQQRGYHIVGMHGNSSKFYRRHMIWPVLGVQEMYFDEDFAKLSMPLCGNNEFKGVCDTAIDSWLFNRIDQHPQQKEFYYWVTLNTHLPIMEVRNDDFNRFAEKWKQEGIPGSVLQLAYQHRLLFIDMARKLSRQPAANIHIALIGDHAPPFITPEERNQYNDKLVPYVEIRSAH